MLASPFTQSVNRGRLDRLSIVLSLCAAFLAVSEPARAQICYQFSNAQGDAPATVTATFPITTIPDSLVPPGLGNVDFVAAFSSAPGLDGTRVSYSSAHVATIVEGGTTHTFNTFTVTLTREGTARRLQFDGTNYPPIDPDNTFSVFIQQTPGASTNPFPDGFTATPPPFTVWGDRPSSSMDLGHVKLASVSFVGPCPPQRSP